MEIDKALLTVESYILSQINSEQTYQSTFVSLLNRMGLTVGLTNVDEEDSDCDNEECYLDWIRNDSTDSIIWDQEISVTNFWDNLSPRQQKILRDFIQRSSIGSLAKPNLP